jgi:hypothetical protein
MLFIIFLFFYFFSVSVECWQKLLIILFYFFGVRESLRLFQALLVFFGLCPESIREQKLYVLDCSTGFLAYWLPL